MSKLAGDARISVVVESGSCSLDSTRWEARAHCGHAHRSEEAAEACLLRHTRSYCRHGRPEGTPCARCNGARARGESCSAAWYHARYHDQIGMRIPQ